jgi:hypothetical protein
MEQLHYHTFCNTLVSCDDCLIFVVLADPTDRLLLPMPLLSLGILAAAKQPHWRIWSRSPRAGPSQRLQHPVCPPRSSAKLPVPDAWPPRDCCAAGRPMHPTMSSDAHALQRSRSPHRSCRVRPRVTRARAAGPWASASAASAPWARPPCRASSRPRRAARGERDG